MPSKWPKFDAVSRSTYAISVKIFDYGTYKCLFTSNSLCINNFVYGEAGNKYALMYVCMYVCWFQNVFIRYPTPRLHCFQSSHWPSFRFLSFMAFLIPSIQFFFGLPRALFCIGIHFNAILGNPPSAIL